MAASLDARWRRSADIRGPQECWPWTGAKIASGYGQIKMNGRVTTAHRVAWILATREPIPDGMVACHRCDNPGCVNPGHLFLGTQFTNIQDARRKGRLSYPHKKKVRAHTRVYKLTDDQVRAIRLDLRDAATVGYEFDVDAGTVYNIRARRRKALVPDDGPVGLPVRRAVTHEDRIAMIAGDMRGRGDR